MFFIKVDKMISKPTYFFVNNDHFEVLLLLETIDHLWCTLTTTFHNSFISVTLLIFANGLAMKDGRKKTKNI